jgi:hypothetical protein
MDKASVFKQNDKSEHASIYENLNSVVKSVVKKAAISSCCLILLNNAQEGGSIRVKLSIKITTNQSPLPLRERVRERGCLLHEKIYSNSVFIS